MKDDDSIEGRRKIADLPTGLSTCHGDFHPGNVLLGKTGPMLIDWTAGLWWLRSIASPRRSTKNGLRFST